ncbi:MAG: hypothetical protein IPJ88_04950 [Myxococcales bacterium]|nr:MAG: hypothetical protein IPJ88_04950 [Myxococcales bacterium]
MRRNSVLLFFLLLCLSAVFVFSLYLRDNYVLDDAFIYQNYLRSILNGHGIQYGPGTVAEGYSSPLWLFVLVAFGCLGASGILWAKALSALVGLATVLLLSVWLYRRCGLWQSALLGFLCVLQPALLWVSFTGMESALFMFLLTAFAIALLDRSQIGVVLSAGLLAVVRPEGPMFLLPALLFAYREYKAGRLKLDRFVGLGLLACLPLLSWQLFRWVHYDALIANSAYAKMGPIMSRVSRFRGVLYIVHSVLLMPAAWILLVAGLAAVIEKRSHLFKDVNSALVSFFVLPLIFIVSAKGDWMPWLRFLVPLLPAAMLVGFVLLHEQWPQQKSWIIAFFVLCFLSTLTLQARDWEEIYAVHWPSHHKLQAKWPSKDQPFVHAVEADRGAHFYARNIYRYTKPGEAVVHIDIGQSGYLAGDIHLMDSYGLVSRFECEYMHGRYSDQAMLEHFRQQNPSLVFFLWDEEEKRAVMPAQRPLVKEINARYQEVEHEIWWGDYTMRAMVRRELLERKGDPERRKSWEAAAPGLHFSPDWCHKAEKKLEGSVCNTP